MELPSLPVPFMNQDHDHARQLLETMLVLLDQAPANQAELARVCREFVEHNRAHFAREEAAMKETAFPPYPVHKAEHEHALGYLDQLAREVENGPPSPAWLQAIRLDLPDWYLRHIQTMDSVTARWIAEKTP